MSNGYATMAIGKAELISSSKRRGINSPKQKLTVKEKLRNWLFKDNTEEITIDEDGPTLEISRDKSIRFEIHYANGGRIVQTRRYDSHKERHVEGLYVITPEQELGREIEKILTMESLKA